MTVSLTLTFGKILKRFISVSATDFRRMAVEQHERQEEPEGAWQSAEPVARTLVEGLKMALDDSRFEVLVPRLNAIDAELRGFAYEGAGTGLAILDSFLPWKNRLKAFVDGPGAPYIYPVHIGVGLALARLGRRPERFLARLDPVLCWLAIDGYGFYEGFFSWQRTVKEKKVPAHLSGYALHVFDQGLGRSIWFSLGDAVDQVVATIAAFPSARQADLWSGAGFACAYAGGFVDRAALEALQTAAGTYRSQLALAGALAAHRRQRAGNQAPHTDLACEVFCGLSSETAAHMAEVALRDLPDTGAEPAYKIWRQRLEEQFTIPAAGEIHS